MEILGKIKISQHNLLIVSLIIVSACIIFYPFLEWLVKQFLFNPWASHGFLIPFASLYILYRETKGLEYIKEEGISDVVAGGAFIAVSLAVFFTQPYIIYKLGAVMLYLLGCSIFFYGLPVLYLAFKPVMYLLFMYPIPADFLYTYGATLSTFTGQVTFGALKMFGLNPLYTESPLPVISLISSAGQNLSFMIDVPCMGAFMLIGFIAFATFIALITRGSIIRKSVAFVIGMAMMIALNILRIISICLIGYGYGPDLALQGFHLLGGWVIFSIGIPIYLIISSKIIRRRSYVSTVDIVDSI